ncbi:MAG: hypothetical protein WC584_01260 [Candidatus Pacearchaeota archaeon]
MKKIAIALFIILLLILSSYFFLNSRITGKSISEINNYRTFTKAICNETNFCQDFIISCNGNKTLEIKSITGAAVQLPSNWEDPRNEEKNKLCD